MRHAPLIAAFLLVSGLLVPSGAAADAASIAAQLGDRIHVGAVDHPDTNVGWGKAVGVVDAPFDVVMATVRDYPNYREFLPHFRESRVLSRRGDRAMVYMEASVVRNSVTLWAQMSIRPRPPRGETQIIEGSMTQGNMDIFQARWEIAPLDGGRRTLVSFQLLVDPDLPMPASVFTNENIKSARRTIEALRRRLVHQR